MTMPKVEIKGWDWTELVPALLGKSVLYYQKKYGTDYNDDRNCQDSEAFMIADIKEKLNDIAWKIEGVNDSRIKISKKNLVALKQKIALVRKFVAAVAKEDKKSPAYPLFCGLRDIKHDWTFLKYTSILLEYLWT